mgnify:CR=1 FL=1
MEAYDEKKNFGSKSGGMFMFDDQTVRKYTIQSQRRARQQSAQTMQTEAADTETTEALDSTEESDTEYIDTTYTPEKIREILFGEWKVSKFLGFTKVQNDYAIYPDGHDIIGDHIVINEHTFSSERIEKIRTISM